jgi:hypothetical protein
LAITGCTSLRKLYGAASCMPRTETAAVTARPSIVAVIVASPLPTGLIRPASSTVATAGSLVPNRASAVRSPVIRPLAMLSTSSC